MLTLLGAGGGEVQQRQGDSKEGKGEDTHYVSKCSVPSRPQVTHLMHTVSFIPHHGNTKQ